MFVVRSMIALVALVGFALAACPSDTCSLSHVDNTAPTVSATLVDGVLTIQATSYGGQSILVGQNAEDTSCPHLTASGNGDTSTDCERTLSYTYDWATLVSNCNAQQLLTPTSDFIRRQLRVMVIDDEISGSLFNTNQCLETYHLILMEFNFPVSVTGTTAASISTDFEFAETLVNTLTHDLDTDETVVDVALHMTYPYGLNQTGEFTPTGLVVKEGPPNLPLENIAVTVVSETGNCDSGAEGICEYVFQFTITEGVCSFDGDNIEPFGTYTVEFEVEGRGSLSIPDDSPTRYNMTFVIDSDLVQCTPEIYTGAATLSPYTTHTDLSSGSQFDTSVFFLNDPITLVVPVAVDFDTPLSGRLASVTICEFESSADADNNACTSPIETITYNSGSGSYDTSSNIILRTETNFNNIFLVENSADSSNPAMQITFVQTSFQSTSSVVFLRFEVLVNDLKYVGDAKKKSLDENLGLNPVARASMAVTLKPKSATVEQHEEKSDQTNEFAAVEGLLVGVLGTLVVVGLAYAAVTRRRSHRGRATVHSLKEEDLQ